MTNGTGSSQTLFYNKQSLVNVVELPRLRVLDNDIFCFFSFLFFSTAKDEIRFHM